MWTLFLRQRRRYIFVTVFFAICALYGASIQGSPLDFSDMEHSIISIVALFIVVIFLVASVFLVALLFPGSASIFELLVISMLVAELWFRISKPIYALTDVNIYFSGAFCVSILICFLASLSEGSWFRCKRDLKSVSYAMLPVPISVAFRYFDLKDGSENSHVSAHIYSIRRYLNKSDIDDETEAYEVSYAMGNSNFQNQIQIVEHREVDHRFCYSFKGVSHKRTYNTGSIDFEFTEISPEKTKIKITSRRANLNIIQLLFVYLDDKTASEIDGLAARIRKKRDWSTMGRYFSRIAARI